MPPPTDVRTIPNRRRRRLGVMFAVAALVALGASCAPDSTNIPAVRNVRTAWIDVDGTTGGKGTMGVDVLLGDNYNPCHLQTSPLDPGFQYNDPYYGACQDSQMGRISYYRALHYRAGGTEIANGFEFGNMDANVCNGASWCHPDPVLGHDWANKATAWAIEFYPSDSTEGGLRVHGRFDRTADDGRAWSGPIGVVRPPRDGDPGMFRLGGWVTGGPWPDDRWEVQAFQMPPFTTTTSAGVPQQGFALARNWGGGLYGTGPLPSGSYKLYVWDNHTGQHFIVYRSLGPGSQLDVHPGQPCFGLAGALHPGSEAPAC